MFTFTVFVIFQIQNLVHGILWDFSNQIHGYYEYDECP
jgi:hypothetical protein